MIVIPGVLIVKVRAPRTKRDASLHLKAEDIDRWLTELDADTSGTLDTTEIAELLRRMGEGIGTSSLKAVMTILDSDKNGTVSKLEFDVWYREQLTWSA